MPSTALLKLLYLVSPTLPIGAYAYSQGQEYAIDAGWLASDDALRDWTVGVMRNSIGNTDLPVLARTYTAWEQSDIEQVRYWNQYLYACRETKELLLEDEQLGQGLARILTTHGVESHQAFEGTAPLGFAPLFALAGVHWQISLEELCHGFLWSWLENQIAAATKAVPLGQTQAQRIMMALMDEIPAVIEHAMALDDQDIGLGLPGLALASCLHERQYSRLFRS